MQEDPAQRMAAAAAVHLNVSLSLFLPEHILGIPSAIAAMAADAHVSFQPSGDVLPFQVQRLEGNHPGAGAMWSPCNVFGPALGPIFCDMIRRQFLGKQGRVHGMQHPEVRRCHASLVSRALFIVLTRRDSARASAGSGQSANEGPREARKMSNIDRNATRCCAGLVFGISGGRESILASANHSCKVTFSTHARAALIALASIHVPESVV